jgi:hypothetical protein
MTDINFLNTMIDTVYNILVSETCEWPYELEMNDKQEFVSKMIEHYAKNEDYEKCSKLQSLLKDLSS